jgi:hypothetical protein
MAHTLLNRWIIITFLFLSGTLFNNLKAFSFQNLSERYYYGGYIGIELGLVNQFEGAPVLGYMISPRLQAGIGAKYQYYHDRRLNQVFRAHLFGPLAFTDFSLVRDLDEFLPFRFVDGAFILHAEMNYFSLPTSHFDLENNHAGQSRFFRPTWLVGAGLRREAGQSSFFHVLLMFDVSGHDRPVYHRPVVRFGFIF